MVIGILPTTKVFTSLKILVTHDMNSVIEIGDNVVFINEGQNWWQGTKKSIITTDNEAIIDFVYASEFMKEIKEKMQR
ncbi:MAG: hypothetical protein HYZ42_17680 [Bacteroidetes bacterium]|nr:hypothetical protein [Bacteroidota bacterium]